MNPQERRNIRVKTRERRTIRKNRNTDPCWRVLHDLCWERVLIIFGARGFSRSYRWHIQERGFLEKFGTPIFWWRESSHDLLIERRFSWSFKSRSARINVREKEKNSLPHNTPCFKRNLDRFTHKNQVGTTKTQDKKKQKKHKNKKWCALSHSKIKTLMR